MINFKVGILGTGSIAGTIADTLNKLDSFEPYAVASRSLDKANEFGDKYNISKRYGSYEELAVDPEVELIYIATPHSHHAEHAMMCLNAGKPVLVEKAFSYNLHTAKKVIDLAKEKKLFCGEAMWTRFLPMYATVAEVIKKGVIGTINCVTCSLGGDLHEVERLTNPELAGGALLDLGVYPINICSMLFGNNPAAVSSTCAKLQTGVDAQAVIQIDFSNGPKATCVISMLYEAPNNMIIYGTNGYIEIENILDPESITVYRGNKKVIASAKRPEQQISGYEFEFIAARNAIILGDIEFKVMPHAETLRIMSILDTLRCIWGVRFPMETDAEIPQLTKGPARQA